MPAEIKDRTLSERLEAKRAEMVEAIEKRINEREALEHAFEERMGGDKKPSDAEVTAHTEQRAAYRAEMDQAWAEVAELDARVKDQADVERRRDEAADAAKRSAIGPVEIVVEPMTYERYKAQGEDGVSYYRDLAAALVPGIVFQGTDQSQALERLNQHAKELRVEMPKREKEKTARARKQLDEAEGRALSSIGDPFSQNSQKFRDIYNPFEQRVEPNAQPGAGGYFIPPLWLVDQFIPGLRAHLIAAGLCRQLDLPAGTDSINIPKLANLTTVGYQQMNNAGLPSADWSDTSVTANIKTIGGYSDVALQLLEQSPHMIVDEVVTTDLMAAHNKFLDQQVIAGDGIDTGSLNGGHLQGIYNGAGGSAWSNANVVTYTSGSPAPWHFPSIVGAMASQIAETRFDASNFKLVTHGRRWFWASTGVDSNDRPLGESMSGGRFNIAAAVQSGLQAEGLVGTMPAVADVPVYIDDNITTTDTTGSGSGQDVAIAALWDDCWLFRGDVRTNVYREILSGSLGVRFQAYSYDGFLVRYGQSLAIACGTGFAAPQGAVASILY
jgi:HK97 family phage major capsid protein